MIFGTGRVGSTSANSISHRNAFLNLSHLPHLLLTSLKHQLYSEEAGFRHHIFNYSQVFPHCLLSCQWHWGRFWRAVQLCEYTVFLQDSLWCSSHPIDWINSLLDWKWDPKYSRGNKYHTCLELGKLSHSSRITLDVAVYMWSHYSAQI